jgi:hypothetical protein
VPTAALAAHRFNFPSFSDFPPILGKIPAFIGNRATLVTLTVSTSGSKFISGSRSGQLEITMKALINAWIARVPALLRSLGPYAAIELLLPGGSVIALLIWLYRTRAASAVEIATASAATHYSKQTTSFAEWVRQLMGIT